MRSPAAARILRLVKYGLAAPLIGVVVRNSRWLDGADGPPAFINYAGGGDFTAVGDQQAELIAARAGLTGADRVLEIGCGIGRIACALGRRHPALDYLGFDVVSYGIDWSRKRLAARPGFRFVHADLRNGFYNPFGRHAATGFRFPADDASRDLVFATSVFTHLLEDAARHYLAEAARVLAPGGRLYLTTFLMPDRPGGDLRFDHQRGRAHLASRAEPELAVAYAPEFWAEAASGAGFQITATWPGAWAGRPAADYQNAILLTRSCPPA